MRKIFAYVILIASPSFLLAASVSIQDSDFIQRVINFVIFAAILWYFAFDSIKGIFVNRRNAIAARLQEVQDTLHKAKQEKELAQKRLEESKERAKEIVNAAKQEAYLVEQKYNEQIKKDIEMFKYALEANMELEKRRAIQESVSALLNELMQDSQVQLNKDDYVNIITKRIS
ncbi:F0F1 ATP synthase subunit B [Helicobacter jaachi]|uniref:ATP synthase subunit b n=1 Tax=Helicobacter jaachi TaxID=1677920 RepID=A0A4U8T8L4_9HELI|nr:F0F1 ATP synthase subunit B [Helicobacter jaachi]TLD96029.1 F0F1 ATP synthase subunit B [Helicobacter jaachi]